uniref:Uncharacterized protein n=1 Tax=Panagrolaimus sp. JU765 TaxID=591449 RepID=A0AC34PZJ2_9BILA
LAEILRYNIFN